MIRNSLHKHHLKPRSRGGTDADGVVYICANCHETRHGGTFGGHKEGLTNTPEVQQKKSEAMKRIWNDQQYRNQNIASRVEAWKSRDRKPMQEFWQEWWTPERRAQRGAEISKRRATRFWNNKGKGQSVPLQVVDS
jgi:hypothetical protein